MNPTVLLWLAFSLWLTVVLTGISFMAMGIELRRRGVSVKWWSLSFSLKTRIETASTVISTYKSFKRDHNEIPVFLWTMTAFGTGIVVVPVIGLLLFLLAAH